MTSSLVGSEMCIRDSRRQATSEWKPGDSTGCCCDAKRRWNGVVRNRSVSYTHLTLPTICSV
eukprot:319442-Prorocentrum_lima.AAC.1